MGRRTEDLPLQPIIGFLAKRCPVGVDLVSNSLRCVCMVNSIDAVLTVLGVG